MTKKTKFPEWPRPTKKEREATTRINRRRSEVDKIDGSPTSVELPPATSHLPEDQIVTQPQIAPAALPDFTVLLHVGMNRGAAFSFSGQSVGVPRTHVAKLHDRHGRVSGRLTIEWDMTDPGGPLVVDPGVAMPARQVPVALSRALRDD